MKVSESRFPQTNNGLAKGVGDGRGGRDGLEGALFGEHMVEAAEGALWDPGEATIGDDGDE
jgi:hypothetical protein